MSEPPRRAAYAVDTPVYFRDDRRGKVYGRILAVAWDAREHGYYYEMTHPWFTSMRVPERMLFPDDRAPVPPQGDPTP